MTTKTTKTNFIFQKILGQSCFLFHISVPSKIFFSLVLFGLDLYNIFQYLTGNFPSSTEFREFQEFKYKISNSGIHVSFSVLRQDREEDITDCLASEISRIFPGKIRFPVNGIRECRPLISILAQDPFITPDIILGIIHVTPLPCHLSNKVLHKF